MQSDIHVLAVDWELWKGLYLFLLLFISCWIPRELRQNTIWLEYGKKRVVILKAVVIADFR